MPIATPMARLGASFLDALVAMAIVLLPGLIAESDNDPPIAGLGMLFLFLCYIVIWVYLMTRGQSIGKVLTGLRVVVAGSHAPLGFGTMLLRETIGKFISSLVFCLGYFWIIFDKEHQGWHDKMVNSVVVKDSSSWSV